MEWLRSQPQVPSTTSSSDDSETLLDAAAEILDKRVGSIRSGSAAPLHPILELEGAARAIRNLAADLHRLRVARGIEDVGPAGRSGARPEPVLEAPLVGRAADPERARPPGAGSASTPPPLRVIDLRELVVDGEPEPADGVPPVIDLAALVTDDQPGPAAGTPPVIDLDALLLDEP